MRGTAIRRAVTAGIRAKTNYLSAVDQYDMGFAYAVKSPTDAFGDQPSWLTRVNAWVRFDNLYLPGMSRPAMGVGGDVNYVDGLLKADLYKNWDLSPFIATPGPKIGIKAYANVSMPSDTLLMPEQWTRMATGEIGGVASYRTPILSSDSNYVAVRGSLALGGGMAGNENEPSRGYARGEGSVTGVVTIRRNGVAGCTCAHMARSRRMRRCSARSLRRRPIRSSRSTTICSGRAALCSSKRT